MVMMVADSICVIKCGAGRCPAFCLCLKKRRIILNGMVYCLCSLERQLEFYEVTVWNT